MRRRLLLVGWCLFLPARPHVAAQENSVGPPPPIIKQVAPPSQPLTNSMRIDEQRLRNLVDLPSTSFKFGCLMPTGICLTNPGDLGDISKRIETVKKQMCGDARDAERHLELARLYGRLKDDKRSRRAELKALELFGERVESDAQNGRLHALLAETLETVERYPEAIKEAMIAVRLAPADGRSWRTLGLLRLIEMDGVLYGSVEKLPRELKNNWDKLAIALAGKKVSAEQEAHAAECLLDASRCFDRAIRAAPEEHEGYRCRVILQMRKYLWSRHVRPEKNDSIPSFEKAIAFPDLKKIMELCPKDPEPIAVHALMTAIVALERAGPNGPEEGLLGLPSVPLSAPQKQACDGARTALAHLAESRNKYVAESAARNLSSLLVMLGDLSGARRYAQRAVDLGTLWEDPWDVLCFGAAFDDELCRAVLEAFSFADPVLCGLAAVPRLPNSRSAALLRKRLARHPSAANHFKLVIALNEYDSQANVERELRQAAAKYPDDLHCQLGMACLLIKKNALAEAAEYISRIVLLRKRCIDNVLWRDCVFTHAVYLSLTGQADTGRQWIRRLHERQPKDERFNDALEAFEEVNAQVPLFPAPDLLGAFRTVPLPTTVPPTATPSVTPAGARPK